MKKITTALCLLALSGCGSSTPADTSSPYPTEIVTMTVEGYRVPCMGITQQECMIVNGENFYDKIYGFTLKRGEKSTLKVKQTRICDPAIPDDCPMDASIYRYELIEVLDTTSAMHPTWDADGDGINDCEAEGICDHTVDYSQPRQN